MTKKENFAAPVAVGIAKFLVLAETELLSSNAARWYSDITRFGEIPAPYFLAVLG